MPIWLVIIMVGITGMGFLFIKAREADDASTIKKVEVQKSKVKQKADTAMQRKTELDFYLEEQDHKLSPLHDLTTPVFISRDENVNGKLERIAEREQVIQDAVRRGIDKEEERGVKIDIGEIKVAREDAARLSAIKIQLAEARTPEEKAQALSSFQNVRADAAKRLADRENISNWQALKIMGVQVPDKKR